MGKSLIDATSAVATRRYEVTRSAASFPRITGVLDRAAVVLILLQSCSVWLWPHDSEIAVEIAKPGGRLLRVLVLLAFAYVCASSARSIAALFLDRHKLLACVLAIAAGSTVWSIAPQTTAMASLDLIMVAVLCLWIPEKLGTTATLRLVFWFGFAVIVLSCLLALAGQPIGLMSGVHAGKWRGLFDHKNRFGEFAAFYALFVAGMANERILPRPLVTITVGMTALALIGAGSATAIGVLLGGALLYPLHGVLISLSRWRILTTVFVVAGALSVGFLLPAMLPWVIESLGRDDTLSGRTDIWSYFLEATWDHAWFGRGYAAYQADEPLITQARELLWGTVRSPHNAYIAMALGIGWPSVVLYAIWHLRVVANAALSRWGRLASARPLFVISTAYLVNGMLEISGAAAPSTGLCLMLVCLAVYHKDMRQAASRGVWVARQNALRRAGPPSRLPDIGRARVGAL